MSFGDPECCVRVPPSRVACRGRHRAEGCRTLDILADNDRPRTPPSRARIRLPLLSSPHRPRPRRGRQLVYTVTEQLGTRGIITPFLFSSLVLDIDSSGIRCLIQAFLRACVPFPAPNAERTWHDEARFAAPAELAMCLCWGRARILRVSGGNAMRGLLSWDVYVEWSEAELGEQLFPPRICNADSLLQYKTIWRPTLKHSSHHYSNLSLQSSSIFSLSSHVSQLTRHRLGTPLRRSLTFLVSFFWPWARRATFPYHLFRIPSCRRRNGVRPTRICSLAGRTK